MPRKQNHAALAAAVRKRRAELDISQQEAVNRTHTYDVETYNAEGEGRAHPGLSRTTWGDMERGAPVKRREPTLRLVDAALRWPEGTAKAIICDEDLPEGAPVELDADRHSNGRPYNDSAVEVEVARALRDVADLRVEVVELRHTVSRLVRMFEGEQ